jgi:antitoxin CptB
MEPNGRLVLRSRRGMKELDVVLERWLARDLPAADAATKATYARLLELQDPELAAHLFQGVAHGDAAIDALLARIRTPS